MGSECMVFSKREIEQVPETDIQPIESTDISTIVTAELEKVGLPQEIVDRVSLELHRNEDYTADVAVNRTIEELPSIVTTLVDIIKQQDGELSTLKDEHGIWLDVVGTKGNIPHMDLPYHRRANISAILTGLVNDVYHHEYKKDEQTKELILDDNGLPIITKRIPINVGTEKRNLDSLNYLAVDANTRNTQARILGAYGGGTGVGIDGRFEDMLSNAFEGRRRKR